jgi:hypothetical protein
MRLFESKVLALIALGWLLVAGIVLVTLNGCGGYHVTAYGPTGKAYIAPDLCAALLACKQGEPSGQCFYSSTMVTSLDGKSTEITSCKVDAR